MRRSFVSVAVGGVILACLLAAGALSEAKGDPTIRGTVLDPEGNPVAGAEVRLRALHGKCTHRTGEQIPGRDVTDEHGRFELPAPPGDMEVYARHDEFAPAWTEARDEVEIRMPVAAWLEGELNTKAGLSVKRGYWSFASMHGEGKYRLGPLPPNEILTVSARSDTHRPFAERISLQPGETRQLDVTLDRGLELKGQVFPAHAGAQIRAHQAGGREFLATSTEDGTFTVTGLEPGWVRLVVISPGRTLQVIDTEAGETVDVRWK